MVNRTKNSPISTGPPLRQEGGPIRGSFRVIADLSGKILNCAWYDNKVVHFLNTAFRASISYCSRKNRNDPTKKDSVECPFLVRMYQRYMRGVDVFDQLREDCSIGRNFRTRRFWLAIFVHLLDTALTNMHILWREKFGKAHMSKSRFMAELHAALLEDGPKFWMDNFEKPFMAFHTPSKPANEDEEEETMGEGMMSKSGTSAHHFFTRRLVGKRPCVVCYALFNARKPIKSGCKRYGSKQFLCA